MNSRMKKLTTLAMLSAIAYIVMAIGRIPIVVFLKYDPKDVIITIGGFIFGPLSAFIISLLVSLVEMFTVSDTGIIGFIMNVISTCAFACTAAFIYERNRTLKGAIIGLITGTLLMTGVMILWNYLITPIYLGYPREAVVAMLIPAFLPFNLLKGGINTALSMLLYKPLVSSLRKSNLIPTPSTNNSSQRRASLGVILTFGIVLITCILIILVINDVI